MRGGGSAGAPRPKVPGLDDPRGQPRRLSRVRCEREPFPTSGLRVHRTGEVTFFPFLPAKQNPCDKNQLLYQGLFWPAPRSGEQPLGKALLEASVVELT